MAPRLDPEPLQCALWGNTRAKFRTDNEKEDVPNSEYDVATASYMRYAPINIARRPDQVFHEGPRNFVYIAEDTGDPKFDPIWEEDLVVKSVGGGSVKFAGGTTNNEFDADIAPRDGSDVLDMPLVDAVGDVIEQGMAHPGHAVEELGKKLPTLDDSEKLEAARKSQAAYFEEKPDEAD